MHLQREREREGGEEVKEERERAIPHRGKNKHTV